MFYDISFNCLVINLYSEKNIINQVNIWKNPATNSVDFFPPEFKSIQLVDLNSLLMVCIQSREIDMIKAWRPCLMTQTKETSLSILLMPSNVQKMFQWCCLLWSRHLASSQAFSMPSKLSVDIVWHGEAKSHYFTVSCVPQKVCLIIVRCFTVISFVSLFKQ